MASTATARSLFAARSGSGAIFDFAVAVAALAGSLALLWLGGVAPHREGLRELDPVGVVLAIGSTAPLIGWRHSPLGVFVLTAAAGVLLATLAYPLDVLLGPGVALYLLAASRGPEGAWTWRIGGMVIGLFAAYLGAAAVAQGVAPGSELLHTGLAWAVAWFAGERTRLRREQVADLSERALRAERDLERERLLAAAEERARIARDLHDSAGHAINVIAVRAGAARLRHAEDPDRSLAALEAIEQVARQTAEEIDQIVGSLRQSGSADGEVDAPHGLASLGTLIGRHREAGLEVTFDVSGTPRRLIGVVDQAAYRLVQEALTNAARHGAGSAEIDLAFGEEWLELTVSNPVTRRRAAASARGHGLVGMRERATLVGGSLDADRADGIFRVRARLPYRGRHS